MSACDFDFPDPEPNTFGWGRVIGTRIKTNGEYYKVEEQRAYRFWWWTWSRWRDPWSRHETLDAARKFEAQIYEEWKQRDIERAKVKAPWKMVKVI